jgi:hypothetical protein
MCDVLRDSDLPKAGIVLEDLANGKTRWFPVTSTAAKPDNEVSVLCSLQMRTLRVHMPVYLLH